MRDVGTLAVGAVALPESYEARARVLLELVSPDLVTGTEVATKASETYVRTQQLLVMSERVALRVVEKLGWAENPAVIEAWTSTTGGVGDVKLWAARRIMSETAAVPLENGGTLEIIYRAPDIQAATLIAGLVRESYIETALGLQTEGSARRADRYDVLAREARERLAASEAAYTALQRRTGVVADSYGNDIERAALDRLQANALNAEVAVVSATNEQEVDRSSLASQQLREQLVDLEQRISFASTSLGPDNPQLQMLLARRDSARRALATSLASGRPSSAAAGRAMANEAQAAYRDERARSLARGPNTLALANAQREVVRLRSDLRRIMSNGATLRMQSERTESGLVIMGDVIAKPEPVAPNLPVIATLATLFGLGLGLVAVILDGLLRREVLGTADLAYAAGVPVLGVVPSGPVPPRWRQWLARLRRRPRLAAA